MTEATLALPWPPTANTYYRNVVIGGFARVLISEKGREYKLNVQAAVLKQGWPKFHEDRLSVSVIAHAPDRRDRDLDNLWKPILDGLAGAGVYTNDAQIDHAEITRGAVSPGAGRLEVTIRSVETSGLFTGGGA